MSLEHSKVSLSHNSARFSRVMAPMGDTPMIFETGRIAKQANGAVWVCWGDSVVLVTVCMAPEPRGDVDFFPLICEYIEKTYAAGRIPGGFFKRESRPRESEILNARIIDRSIRPLFPDDFFHEVQVMATVLSYDGEHDTDVMALCGASMALHVSDIPFALEGGPIAGVRVGRIEKQWIANPTLSQRQESDVDIMVALSQEAIVMVEGGGAEILESELIDGLYFAHTEGQKIITACHQMREAVGKEKVPFAISITDEDYKRMVRERAIEEGIREGLAIKEKLERRQKIHQIKTHVLLSMAQAIGDMHRTEKAGELALYFDEFEKELVRLNIIERHKRLDNRLPQEIRPICCEVGVLPRTHGSSLFTRGETQALVSVTLGTREDEQKIDTLVGESWRRFMLHYNFPPFSVGEVRMLRGTSRREIGHGALAERAVEVMSPPEEDFPYTIRIVSEIMESNGSSSMASVCGATLALWDAGVQMKAPVAGIAMGLIKEGGDIVVLSDISGDEDHLGDMDFKVCGTAVGVTAIQMDIKISGLTRDVLTTALTQAREGRLFILKEMQKALLAPRQELSAHAPRILTMRIKSDRIRDVIGPGGRVIRDIIAKTGAKVDVTDEGIITIAAVGASVLEKTKQMIEDLTREAEINRIYKGFVQRIVDFGAFIEIFPGTEGLCHISELSEQRVAYVTDVLKEGEEVNVVVLSIDREGKIRLSRKRAENKQPGEMI